MAIAGDILNFIASCPFHPGTTQKVPRKKILRCVKGAEGSILNALTKLCREGFITMDAEKNAALTAAGRARVAPRVVARMPRTNQDVLKQVMESLSSKKTKAILQIVSDGRVHSRNFLRQRVAPQLTLGSFNNLLGDIRKHDWIDYVVDQHGDKAVVATDALFPFGRPSMTSGHYLISSENDENAILEI